MAADEAVDEFEAGVAPVVEDTARSLTSGIVFVTTVLLVVAIIVTMIAAKTHFGAGWFA